MGGDKGDPQAAMRLPWGSGPVQSVKFKFNFKLNLIMDVGWVLTLVLS